MAKGTKKESEFGGMEYKCKVRPGSKAPWWEMQVTKPDGTVIKMIARKVDRFYSEQDEDL